MGVRKLIQHVNKHVSSSNEKENSGLCDLPDSSDMLTQPAQARCTEQNQVVFFHQVGELISLGLLQYAQRKRCLFFLCVAHSQCFVCSVWSRCLLIRLICGFCMQDCVNSGGCS